MRVVRRAGASSVGQAEPAHGDLDADIGATWMGTELLIVGYPTGALRVRQRKPEILAELTIEGHPVIDMKRSGRRRLSFECKGFAYEVNKSADDEWDPEIMNGFVAQLIEAAGC